MSKSEFAEAMHFFLERYSMNPIGIGPISADKHCDINLRSMMAAWQASIYQHVIAKCFCLYTYTKMGIFKSLPLPSQWRGTLPKITCFLWLKPPSWRVYGWTVWYRWGKHHNRLIGELMLTSRHQTIRHTSLWIGMRLQNWHYSHTLVLFVFIIAIIKWKCMAKANSIVQFY